VFQKEKGRLKRKVISGMMLTLLFIGMLTLAFNIQLVRAEPRTWIVDDDGPADFSSIQEAINAANSGDTIFVCNGTYYKHIVVNKSVKLIGEDKNTTIIDGGYGRYASDGPDRDYVVEIAAFNVSISGFMIQNGYRGPLLGFYYAGIYVGELSANNMISDNIIKNNANGIQLDSTSGNNISNNIIKDNGYWLETSGIYVQDSSYNNIDNNYISRNQGRGISMGAGSEYNNISNNIVENHIGDGVYLIGSTYNNISNNTITSNKNGIRVAHAPFNFFSSNAMLNNTYNFGVNVIDPEDSIQDIDTSNTVNEKPIYYLLSQSNLIVEPSTFPEIGYLGIIAGNNITVRNLTLTKNEQGLLLYGVSNSVVENVGTSYNFFGMVIMDSSNNTIKGCAITNNQDSGISLDGDNNTVSDNTILNNGEVKLYPDEVWGGWREYVYSRIIGLSGDNNTIYHNNFINNIGSIDISGDGNSWDNGYPSGGNYWSDYNGTDFYNGPYQDETGSDGIGDTPYVIDEFNQDSYPLMRPFLHHEHDLAVSLRASHYHCIYGTSSILEAAVYNLGLSDENNVRLELLIDDNVVDSIVIPQLASGSNYTYTLNYTWTPTVGDRYCNVTAYVNSVPGENIIANNVASTPVLVYHIHDVAIVSVTPPEKWVIVEGMGQIVNINITIKNKGTAIEYVTAQYRGTALGMPLIDWTAIGNVTNLSPSAEATLTFSLNTTGMLMGVNYTIYIVAGLPDRKIPFREYPTNIHDNYYYYWFNLIVMPQLNLFNITCEGQTYTVTTLSHTPLSNFNFSQQEMQISFDLADPHPYPAAYCTVMIPNNLLTGNPWTITIDGMPIIPDVITENATHTMLYFTYIHSTHKVQIIGTWVIGPPPTPPVGGKANPIDMQIINPELQIPWIWLSIVMLSLVLTVVCVKKRKRGFR